MNIRAKRSEFMISGSFFYKMLKGELVGRHNSMIAAANGEHLNVRNDATSAPIREQSFGPKEDRRDALKVD